MFRDDALGTAKLLPKTGGIYKIKNIITGLFYIGQTTNLYKRRKYHICDLTNNKYKNPHLQNSWNKHGGENFIFEILIHCESSELDKYEQFFVDTLKPEYNIMKECVSSPKGLTLSEEHKKKLSISHMGKPGYWKGKEFSDEHRRKLSEWQKGKKFSKERKEKQSISMLNHKVTDEGRKNMSKAQKGHLVSPEQRLKISNTLKNRHLEKIKQEEAYNEYTAS